MRLLAALAAITLIVAACGDETTTATPQNGGPDQRYTATATVLESPEHGPQLCLGGVDDSLPPQCGGPDVPNWNWDDVDDAESRSGTTWGVYTVVGTYGGAAFTLTEAPQPPTEPDVDTDSVSFPTPCEEPDGGWAVVDDQTATSEAMDAATTYAAEQADHAGTWLDQSINPAMADDADADEIERLANDPTKLILNFRFTGDLDRHKSELRSIWGGALCVSMADRTEAELVDTQRELHDDYDGLLGSGISSVTGQIDVHVIADDGSLQAELDERYGDGLIVVQSALQPVD